MRNCLLICTVLLFSQPLLAQRGMVFIKKHGYRKKASYAEGDPFMIRTKNGILMQGFLTAVIEDSIYINGNGYHKNEIKAVVIRQNKKIISGKESLLTAMGVAIITAGLTLAQNQPLERSFRDAMVIGYSPYVLRLFPLLKRRKYPIGRKFTIQTLDLHFNGRPQI